MALTASESMIPDLIPNQIAGAERPASERTTFEKLRPTDGSVMAHVARSSAADVDLAVEAAAAAQPAWAALPAVERGTILRRVAQALVDHASDITFVVAEETGKSPKDAAGEAGGAAQLGFFYAGEGQRLFGRTLPSGAKGKMAMTIRQPIGVAGLIIAANTPIANVAWKVFPALICGNAVVLKAAEDTPATAWLFSKLATEAGLPPGTLNVVQGLGHEAGEALVQHAGVGVISFTGSSAVGKRVQSIAANRLARVSLELGGKNPLVVCDDADMQGAIQWSLLSAFSNAGQRCASASRLIVMDRVYDAFVEELVARTGKLKLGNSDADDLGPVINERQLSNMCEAVREAMERDHATLLCGGDRQSDPEHASGYYMTPTLLENVSPEASISRTELFGPIAIIYRVGSLEEAIALANDSPYGLTAAIHTRDINRALAFANQARAGMVNINGGTYGSEPHFPFGGFGLSGNGSREPGTEALDVYTELKNVVLNQTSHLSP